MISTLPSVVGASPPMDIWELVLKPAQFGGDQGQYEHHGYPEDSGKHCRRGRSQRSRHRASSQTAEGVGVDRQCP